MLNAIKDEEKKERERTYKLSVSILNMVKFQLQNTFTDYDRQYLEKIYGLERAKARARLDRVKQKYDNKINGIIQNGTLKV